MSKYQPLADYLKGLDLQEIELTFNDVESTLGFKLPLSAQNHNAWWANSKTNDSHTWAHRWMEAGWEVQALKIKQKRVIFQRSKEFVYLDIDSPEAKEGYELDSRILTRSRNSNLADKRKVIDNFQCQVCSFRLEVNGSYAIEVHHLNPLSVSGETVTSIEDLVSLCPTCHRIAHLRRDVPFTVNEISIILSENKIT